MFLTEYLSPITELESWCKKYGLEVRISKCKRCGKTLETNIPFATKEVRGLYSDVCECGNEKTPFVFTPKD